MGLNSVRITPENETHLKEKCTKRGDKSKIINEALSKFFLPEEKPIRKNVKPEIEIIG